LSKQLLAASTQVKEMNDVEFYKVPFEQALDLVAQRRVFLSKGFVFVPSTDLGSLLVAQFRSNLSKSLVVRFLSLFSYSTPTKYSLFLSFFLSFFLSLVDCQRIAKNGGRRATDACAEQHLQAACNFL
jgi:hypothetical protein